MRVSGWLYLLQQTLTSFCLLWATGLSAGLSAHRPYRALLLSPLMALLTLAGHSLPAGVRLLALPLAAGAPLAAFPGAPRRLHLRMAAMGLLLPMTLTGLIRLLMPLGASGTLLLGAASAALPLLTYRLCRVPPTPRCTSVELRLGCQRTILTALVDTGNLLSDSVTGLPVIVISRRAAARLMTLPPEGTLLPGMRLMRVRTVSGTALMTLLRPDAVRVRIDGEWKEVSALLGLSPCGYEGFQALLPARLDGFTSDAIPQKAISQGG